MYCYPYTGKKCKLFSFLIDQMVRLWTVYLDIFNVAQLAMLRRKRFLISCVKLGKGQFTVQAVLFYYTFTERLDGELIQFCPSMPIHAYGMWSVTVQKGAAWCGLNPVYVQAVC